MPADETVYLVAHPDDEVLGAGGQMGDLPRPPLVIHVTDGAPRDLHDARANGFLNREGYAAARRQEAQRALATVGIPPERILSLEAADQEASLGMAELALRFARMIESLGARVIYTHPYEGGHPDHDATALIAHAACAWLARHRPGLTPELHEFASYHAGPDGAGLQTGIFLAPNRAAMAPSHPDGDRLLELSAGAATRKREMLAAFVTQQRALPPFPHDLERFRKAPPYVFTAAPHPGPLYYDRFAWGMNGERWRQLAATALRELGFAPEAPL